MERPLTTLIFVISGFAFSILSFLVESQPQDGAVFILTPPPPSPPPPPPPPPPLPPPPSPSPPPPPSPSSPPPPSSSPPPPPASPPPPPPSPPPPPPPSPVPPPPPPPPRRRRPPPSNRPSSTGNGELPPGRTRNNHQGAKQSLNKGKTVGLFFVGIAAVLQVCVVGFLVFKRRQLLRFKDRYESS